MKLKLLKAYVRTEEKIKSFLQEERGATDFIAIILIILAVIAVAAIFKDALLGIVEDLMEKIRELLGL